jgi:hypothetical protein
MAHIEPVHAPQMIELLGRTVGDAVRRLLVAVESANRRYAERAIARYRRAEIRPTGEDRRRPENRGWRRSD